MFKLSKKSEQRLEGVEWDLKKTVKEAIKITKIDFGVIEGLRTEERQKELLENGATKTLKSKHLDGRAVDLMAYINGRASWELNLYDEIADAMKQASEETGAKIKWGAAWNIYPLTSWTGNMEEAMNHYIDVRRKEGRRPFIDAPHFELM